jgi:hypothetical protein
MADPHLADLEARIAALEEVVAKLKGDFEVVRTALIDAQNDAPPPRR